jgi:hypothetical protein
VKWSFFFKKLFAIQKNLCSCRVYCRETPCSSKRSSERRLELVWIGSLTETEERVLVQSVAEEFLFCAEDLFQHFDAILWYIVRFNRLM